MADLSDVTTVLKEMITDVLYPGGAPDADDVSAAGMPVRIVEGWPEKDQLDAILEAGRAMVSVLPSDFERLIQMANSQWRSLGRKTATYTLTRVGQTVTVGGAAPGAYFLQNLAILANGQAYIATATPDATPAELAAELFALVSPDFPGVSTLGSTLTFPDDVRLEAVRVGTVGSAIREVRRQERGFQISVWAGSPEDRKAIGALVDAQLTVTAWVDLPDQSPGRLLYRSQTLNDTEQLQGIWRRDFIYTVEFCTTETEEQVEIVTFLLNMRDASDVIIKTERA